uniref:Putative O-acetyl transferase n=1 Tax=Cryptococcus neoformans TaxID=5207 RepID=A5D940_CRYNE|nr:TPA_inf: putative O-acetyl transferase [Cryptococcus neoformans var. grubii]
MSPAPAPHLTNKLIPPPEEGEDPTQLSLMISAKPYLALDKYLDRLRNRGAIKLDEITRTPDHEKRMALWKEFAHIGEGVSITQQFFCEYGFNLHFAGENFVGANCTFADVCPTRTGLAGEEWGKIVRIEEDCWICGSAIILPGVTIGKGSTIAAGAVVTKSIPPRSLVMGNPARVVKKILEDGTTVKV